MLSVVAYLLLAHSAVDPIATAEKFRQDLFRRLAPGVVLLSTDNKFGSGTVLTDDGLVLTNAHVVGKKKTVRVVLHDGTKLTGNVVEVGGDDIDVAIVQVHTKKPLKYLTVGGHRDLRIGSWVAAVGHGHGGAWTFNTGMVSNLYAHARQRPVFQTQIPLNPGNSGGPVVDRQGRVVGIVTAGIQAANNINFSIAIEIAMRALKKVRFHCQCLHVQAPAGLPVFLDGTMVGTGPRLLLDTTPGMHELFVVVQGQMKKRRLTFPNVREVVLEAPRR